MVGRPTNHDRIYQYLKGLGLFPDDILKINSIETFKECDINKAGSVYNKLNGRVLRGSPSPNKGGRSKKAATEEAAQDKNIRSVIDAVRKEVDINGGLTEQEVRKLIDGLILGSKTTFELKDLLKTYAQFYLGKKQSIENKTNEKKELIIKIGTEETTNLLGNLQQKIIDVTPSTEDEVLDDRL